MTDPGKNVDNGENRNVSTESKIDDSKANSDPCYLVTYSHMS